MEPTQSSTNKDLILREKMALERTKMANYRTFLAFLRTSLYFPVAGISMHQALSLSYGKYLQLAGIIIGAIVLIAGFVFNVIAARRIKAFEASIGTHFQPGED
jgi:putative membrane protein